MRLCLPIGPNNSPTLAIIGEAPGQHEAASGTPFVGASGKLLTQMLAAAGIRREDCYLTNVMQIRPPGNNFDVFYADGRKRREPTLELAQARERLSEELDKVKPKVIVPVGKEALKAIADTADLKNYRGTMLERYGRRILPTYHPAYILRDYAKRPIVEMDLRKAHRQALNPFKPQVTIHFRPDFHQVMSFLESRPADVAVDIETVDLLTRCIGFATSERTAIVIPLTGRAGHVWSEEQESEILLALRDFLTDPSVKKYLQNFPFDATILEKELGLRIENIYLDTMFAHHTMYPELPKSLDMLCSLYTDFPMYWGYSSSSDSETQTYCGYDCMTTYTCAKIFRKELLERDLWKFYRSTVHPTTSALTRMQKRGVLIDVETRTKIGEETEAKLEATREKIHTHLGFDLNPSSPKQLQALLYDKWKLPVQRNKEKRPTTDAVALKILRGKFPQHHSLLSNIIEFRELRTLLGTFVKATLSPESRVHTSYNVAGTVTGRLSSSKTIDGLGGNLQNIPRGDFRRIYLADPGYVILKADLRQAEFKVLVWKARISRVIHRILTEPDFNIHMWNASENIYHKDPKDITVDEYSNAKNGTFAANYDVQALKVSRMYDMSFQEAKLILERYHNALPEIQGVYQAEIRTEIRETRILTNPLGRERVFFGRMDEQLFRAAYSHYCQSTVADLINLAIIDLDSQGIELLMQVHDEIVLQCPESEVEAHARAMKNAMERSIKFEEVEEPLVIPVEISVGPNWYETKELEV